MGWAVGDLIVSVQGAIRGCSAAAVQGHGGNNGALCLGAKHGDDIRWCSGAGAGSGVKGDGGGFRFCMGSGTGLSWWCSWLGLGLGLAEWESGVVGGAGAASPSTLCIAVAGGGAWRTHLLLWRHAEAGIRSYVPIEADKL